MTVLLVFIGLAVLIALAVYIAVVHLNGSDYDDWDDGEDLP
jgi:hypothetical protein